MVQGTVFWVIILLLWQGIVQCTAKGPPQIANKVHHRQVAKVGRIIRLSCPVISDPPPLMQWLKDNQAIHGGWDRFRVSQDGLRIKQVHMEDAGHYVCKATNGFGKISLNMTLVVIDEATGMVKQANKLYPMSPDEDLKKEGAEPRFSHPTKMRRTNIVRPVGSSVRLKCKAVGNPRPQLRWLKDESEFRQETEKEKKKEIWTLKLNNLQKEDTGKYMCIVTNRLGKLNYTYHLEIIEKIKSKPVLLAPHPQNTTVEYGETASFQCRVKSEVQPHIQWLKRVDDPSMLINLNTTIDVKGQKFMVLKTGDVWNAPDGSYLNKLIIPRATTRDSGMYICLGATSMGYNFRSAFLTVRSDPVHSSSNQDDATISSNDLVLVIVVPTLVCAVLVCIVLYFIKRSRTCNGRSRRSMRNQRLPVPTHDKDFYPAVHNPHMVQASREKIPSSKNYSSDFQSDISSVSRSHHQQNQHTQYGY